ncbi:hypothetical protein [Chryseobacterium chendengshani]|uniref:hypothetical protein n=1 Tax=Chryseobacterium sp. LJ756 TaxID=2864113 RepID=UPI001C63DE6F|nr:hypothetical protein [Chryseobacterium sp. LJ756]MBW7674870.1 hypothetical protein [Chryseobacterium sp. LJ756]
MKDGIISLKFNKKDFEEIYFRDNQGSLFFSNKTRNLTITAIALVVVLSILYFLDLISIDNFGIYYFLIFILLICVLRLIVGMFETLKWKRGISNYLKSMDVYEIFELQLTDDFLYVKRDDDESYNSWNLFTNIQINDQYISLEGKTNFLFPRKSMNLGDYVYFKDSLKTKLAQKKSEQML